jgi:hypothetical protein
VLGSFQLTIPVHVKEVLLQPEERNLSVLRWVGERIRPGDRWERVFERYLVQIADRVRALGGDPTLITPSPTGNGRHGKHAPSPHKAFTGKVAGLVFDRFGDFDGFILDTKEGEHRFVSRERAIEELAQRAWSERILITVNVDRNDPRRPFSIVLLRRP